MINIHFVSFAVHNMELMISQLKKIYINTLPNICPLPWMDTSADVKFTYDDVFIPLHTLNIAKQENTDNCAEPSLSEVEIKKTVCPSGSSRTRKGKRRTVSVAGPSSIKQKIRKTVGNLQTTNKKTVGLGEEISDPGELQVARYKFQQPTYVTYIVTYLVWVLINYTQ